MIGERLRDIRKEKQLSQGDLEERTGLSRCYLSRIENGHTTPSIETLEKRWARTFQQQAADGCRSERKTNSCEGP